MTDEVGTERRGIADGSARWVAQPGKKIPRTPDGLLDSEMLNRSWYSGDRPVRADSLIGAAHSYVLLAPGGAGKSTLIDELRSSEPDSASVDLRLHSREALAAEIKSVTSRARSVFVDALDEALQLDPNLGYVLVKLLGDENARKVAWRFACRPASWTLDIANGVRAALPDFEELELLPLDTNGVSEIAGQDSDAFVDAVERAHLTRQLAQPLNACALLEQWRSTGGLPATRYEGMRHTVSRLLEESGEFRPGRRQDDERMNMVAERLAAITMLCGVGRFGMGSGAASLPTPGSGRAAGVASAIAVTAVPTDDEPDLTGTPLSVDDLREVLGTALFTAAVNGSVAFRHQSYAEFLAAAYLARRDVGGTRLVSLLGANINGLTPGPMIEILGWMLALGANVPTELIRQNAKPLLATAGLELANEDVRERAVDALLRGAADGTIDEGWGVDTSLLSHPNLATQIHQAVLAAANPWEIFWIARIARHCLVFEAADDLLAIGRNASWPAFIRAEAVQSFAAVAPLDRMAELDSLLGLEASEDPEDEILAAALRAVLPGAVDIDRVAVVLRPPRRSSYIGGYSMLLGELPTLIAAEDALPLLRQAMSRKSTGDGTSFERLIVGLVARAWEVADIDTASELGELLGRTDHLPESWSGTGKLPWEEDDRPALRYAMAAAALSADGNSLYAVLELRLLTPADLQWLVEWMTQAHAEAFASAEVVLRHLAGAVSDSATADFVLGVRAPHPAHDVLAQFQGSVALDARPDWVSQNLQDRGERPSRADLLAALHDSIAAAQDDLATWWKCVVALAGDWQAEGHDNLLAWDLTERALWADLEPTEQEVFWRLALAFVATRQPEPSRWIGRPQWTLDDMMPDCSAVNALATAAVHRPEDLADLQLATWETWAPILVAIPAFYGAETWQPAVYRAAPTAARAAISAAVGEFVRTDRSTSFAYHSLADFSDPDLLEAVAEVARGTLESHERRDAALVILVEHAPTTALDVARSAQSEDSPPAGAAAALASLSPEEYLVPHLADGERLPLIAIPRVDLDQLSDDTLSRLAHALLDELPFADDPARGAGFAESTPESEARRVRFHLLQAMAARGMVGHLEALAEGRADTDAEPVHHVLQQARERQALMSWRPLDPSTMMKLIVQGDARLVRDSGDLVAVLLEQLEYIQRDLRERALFRSLWDGEPGADGASPKLEDDISDWLAHELELRLSPHVLVDREIQVTRTKRSGVGTRIDITVTSPAGIRLGRVPFEAKRVQNDSLLKALHEQLVDQYMVPADLVHGIYIVYWVARSVRPSSWKSSHPDPAALETRLREQARRHRPERQIEVVVLDIGPPA